MDLTQGHDLTQEHDELNEEDNFEEIDSEDAELRLPPVEDLFSTKETKVMIEILHAPNEREFLEDPPVWFVELIDARSAKLNMPMELSDPYKKETLVLLEGILGKPTRTFNVQRRTFVRTQDNMEAGVGSTSYEDHMEGARKSILYRYLFARGQSRTTANERKNLYTKKVRLGFDFRAAGMQDLEVFVSANQDEKNQYREAIDKLGAAAAWLSGETTWKGMYTRYKLRDMDRSAQIDIAIALLNKKLPIQRFSTGNATFTDCTSLFSKMVLWSLIKWSDMKWALISPKQKWLNLVLGKAVADELAKGLVESRIKIGNSRNSYIEGLKRRTPREATSRAVRDKETAIEAAERNALTKAAEINKAKKALNGN